jgi:Asp-tRNA(Asn)/Glu-tRNA(Gln) amidotransferase C subunit
MEIDDKKVGQIVNKLESAIATISRMDMWLPKAIDNAIHGHSGTMDHVDMDRMRKDKKEEEKNDAEMDSLNSQIKASQKQTREIAKQTRYIMWGLVITAVGSLLSLVFQISQFFLNKK